MYWTCRVGTFDTHYTYIIFTYRQVSENTKITYGNRWNILWNNSQIIFSKTVDCSWVEETMSHFKLKSARNALNSSLNSILHFIYLIWIVNECKYGWNSSRFRIKAVLYHQPGTLLQLKLNQGGKHVLSVQWRLVTSVE